MLSSQQGMLLEGLLVKFIVSSEDETQLTGEKGRNWTFGLYTELCIAIVYDTILSENISFQISNNSSQFWILKNCFECDTFTSDKVTDCILLYSLLYAGLHSVVDGAVHNLTTSQQCGITEFSN